MRVVALCRVLSTVVMADEDVGVPWRAFDVGDEGIEPDDLRGQFRGEGGEDERIEAQRAGEEVHAQVEAGAADEQLLNLSVGFVTTDGGVEFDKDQFGDGQAESPP